ncbi:MAG: histidinol dehydrogenase [Acidobacteriota bacterium]|nr:histidinol dehydrogenase [Acidobacteriota bacterium]
MQEPSKSLIEIVARDDKEARERVLRRIASRNVALDADVLERTSKIIEDVRRRGDAALVDYAAQFDHVELDRAELRVDEETLRRTAALVDASVLAALRESIARVHAFHDFERQNSWEVETERGVRLGQRITPVERAGLYVPGGTASYPSSVVMNVVPAQVAGVKRIVVTTPPRSLHENPAVSAALVELGVTEVYAVGGAQAIAALAFGTETVPRVDIITGPGNKYVAAAKKLVFGAVGIDSVAGPTEVVIVADETARADFIAADLLAQAEHGEDASAVLLTTSDQLAHETASELARQARDLPRRLIVERSLAQYGAIIVVENMKVACETVNAMAPEHLEIMAREEEEIVNAVHNAGAIFCGAHAPEAVGDYIAGPNHVLPTGGAARFSSALSVQNFLKRTSVIRYTSVELERTAPLIAALAGAEGLDAHARSAMIRLQRSKHDA